MTEFEQLKPFDSHNQKLQSNVHPADWNNPTPDGPYNLVVIGAGTAGLVAAAGAAGLGAKVALIERELMGGDCLNVGCVPSKGLISAARVAAVHNNSEQFGISSTENAMVDFPKVMERMRQIRADISPVDSAKRFTELGVDVFFGQGKFVDNNTIHVTRAHGTTDELNFKKAVIATGARASAPPIPGLDSINYLTNENIFSLTELPKRLGVIGAGPIGSEMAQTFARLGSEVYLFEMADRILIREDAEASQLVHDQMVRDGVNIITGSKDQSLEPVGNGIRINGQSNGQAYLHEVDQLLVAVGRAPNTENLNLESVGVEFDKKGVRVNDLLQTTNKRIFAAGDICSKYQFTHAADFMARAVIQNALFRVGPFGTKKMSNLIIPWATYTSPEIAHVGLYENEAKSDGIEIDTYTQSLEHVDRAILDSRTHGFARVHVRKGTDKIVGATVVAENAGDLISEFTLAMTNRIGLAGIGSTIHPYPTIADSIRKLGDQYNKTRLTKTAKTMLGWLMKFNS